MTWTIIILVLAIALFVFGGMIVKQSSKKATPMDTILNKAVKVVSIILIAGCVCRLWTPLYLTKTNPAILQEMVMSMQAQQEKVKNAEVRKYVKNHLDEMIGDAPIAGNVNAAHTIFLWSDYSCPYCRRVHGELSKVLAERDDVRVVLKNFSIHGALSDAPAKAVIAAKIQGNDKAAALDKLLMDKEYYSHDDMKDQANEDIFLKHALTGFENAYNTEHFPIFELGELTTAYIIATIYRSMGEYDKAMQWVAFVVMDRSVSLRLKTKGLHLKGIIAEEKKKLEHGKIE